jgi:hypothetical protein
LQTCHRVSGISDGLVRQTCHRVSGISDGLIRQTCHRVSGASDRLIRQTWYAKQCSALIEFWKAAPATA